MPNSAAPLNKPFLRDFSKGVCIAYGEFFDAVATSKTYNKYCRGGILRVFESLLASLVFDREIILLDETFSDSETAALTGVSDISEFDEPAPRADFDALRNAFSSGRLRDAFPLENWRARLFTSGTQGRPKEVSHTFASAFSNVKISPRRAADVWGFAYNPTHFAGLQIFMQAFLNGNTLVDIFARPPAEVFAAADKFGITHISATPTFFRLLCGGANSACPSVRRLTSGGERFDARAMRSLGKIFPNAKISNVYASTEYGSMFVSDGDIFTAPAGTAKVVDGELFVLSALGGDSAVRWYPTGDCVEVIGDNPLSFRFLARRCDFINVGGYKVNPAEVEDALRCLDAVSDARVYAIPNRILGNIVAADVVCARPISEPELRKELLALLQNFKIPRIVNFVEALQKTRTGKTSRIV